MVRAPYRSSNTTSELMELLHVDISGPFKESLGGSLYLITLLEDCTGTLVRVPTRNKSDAGKVLRSRIFQLERKCGRSLRTIRFDGAKEFVTGPMQEWCDERGMDVQTTPSYSPQSNGKAELANKTIQEQVGAALSEADVGEALCAEAAAAAIYVMNCLPTANHDLTTWEMLIREKPDVLGLVVWGSPAFALKPPKQQRETKTRTACGKMMSYTPRGHSYRFLLHGGNEVVELRDVVFDEAPRRQDGMAVHRKATDSRTEDGPPVDGATRRNAAQTSTLTPSSSGGQGATTSTTPVTPDVQAAIDAARLLTGVLVSEGASSEEEDEVIQHYPGRTRQPPIRYGDEGAGASANAEWTKSTNKPVYVRDLPPPPKTVA